MGVLAITVWPEASAGAFAITFEGRITPTGKPRGQAVTKSRPRSS